MIYSKNQLLTLAVLASLWGCSAGVDEKKSSDAPVAESMNVELSAKVKTVTDDGTDQGDVVAKSLSMKACLKDPTTGKAIPYESFSLSGKAKATSNKTDSNGCVYWTVLQDVDYAKGSNTKVYNTEIKVNDRLVKSVKYAYNSVNNDFSNCEKENSQLCEVSINSNKAALNGDTPSVLELSRISFSYDGDTKERRSDVKNVDYDTFFSSCLSEVKTGKKLRNTELEVSVVNKENGDSYKDVITTSNAGCYEGTFPAKYAQYDYSHWMKNVYTVKVLEGPLAGQVVSRSMFINPWERSAKLFAKDGRFLKAPKVNPIKKPAQLRLDGVMYIFVGNNVANFKVDNNLGLSVTKTYQVVLKPSTDRGHRFSKDSAKYPPIKYNGKFKLSFMILAPKGDQMELNVNNRNQFDYITGAERVVDINNGTINSLIDLEFKATDLPRLATRAVSVFKLEPLDKSIGLQPTIVTGFFKAKLAWIKTNVLQNDALNVDLNQKGFGTVGETKRNNLEAYTNAVIGKKEEIRKSLETGKVDTSSFNKVENMKRPINLLKNGLTQDEVSFNKFINDLFDYQSRPVYEKVGSDSRGVGLKIFKKHLKKEIKDIEIFDNVKDLAYSKRIKITEEDIALALQPPRGKKFLSKNMIAEICKAGFNVNGKVEMKVFGIFSKLLPVYKECINDPAKYFDINSFRHMSEVTKTTPMFSNGLVLSMGSRFATNIGHSETVYKSIRTGMDMSVKIPLGDFLGLGLRLFDVSYGKSWNDSESTNTGDYVSTNKSASVEKFVINVEGMYDRCVLVRGKEFKYVNPEYYAYMSSPMLTLNAPMKYLTDRANVQFYVCGEQKAEEYIESWYYIQSYLNSSALLRDVHGPTEVKLMKVLRGEKVFRRMYDALVDDTKTYLIKKEVAIDTPEVRLLSKWDQLLDAEFVSKEVCLNAQAKEGEESVRQCTLDNISDEDALRVLKSHVEGTFPGTIE